MANGKLLGRIGWSRTPHGVRGLKLGVRRTRRDAPSRTPHGVRGLKFAGQAGRETPPCRTPHGVRGLKFELHAGAAAVNVSHPSRGAWIEITAIWRWPSNWSVAPLTGCVD